MTGIRTSNRFEVLCELAQSEQWCWNLMCTTCGHGVFRWALKALANGFDPATEEWPVHWGADVTFTMLEEMQEGGRTTGFLVLPAMQRLDESPDRR